MLTDQVGGQLYQPVIQWLNQHRSIILGCILLFGFFVRVPTFFIDHIENDEVVYRALSEQIIKNPLDYSLQNTSILSRLPSQAYNYPVFKHPPLFVIIIAVFRVIGGVNATILVSVIFSLLTVLLTYLTAKRLYSVVHGLLAALILSFCPIWLFVSMKIWSETTLTFFMIMSFYLIIIACDKKQMQWFLLAGVIFGLSFFTKQVSILIIPSIVYYISRQSLSLRNKALFFLCFIAIAFLINIPWLVFYFKKMGTLSYANQYTDLEVQSKTNQFIQETLNRPWYFYFTAIPIIYPVYLMSFFGAVWMMIKREDLSMVIWGTTFFLIFTLCGTGNCFFNGFKLCFILRYLAPALPALAITGAYFVYNILFGQVSFVKSINHNIMIIILLSCLFYGLSMGMINLFNIWSGDVSDPRILWGILTSSLAPAN